MAAAALHGNGTAPRPKGSPGAGGACSRG